MIQRVYQVQVSGCLYIRIDINGEENDYAGILQERDNLHNVIAMSAFVDCLDITRITYWGPPCTLEEFAQETGQVGRNSSAS